MRCRTLTAMLLLALASAEAMADWNKLGNINDAYVYINSSAVSRQGGVARMWDLFDFKSAQLANGKPYLSLVSLAEYDCKQRKTRPLHIIAFTGNMGQGNVASSLNAAGSWADILPTSIEEWLWRRACSR